MQDVKTQIVIINNTPTKLTGPLSFRDVVAGSSTVPPSKVRILRSRQSPDRKKRSPDRPWTEVKHRKASTQTHLSPSYNENGRSFSVATSSRTYEPSRNTINARCGKKTKSKRGGKSPGNASATSRQDGRDSTEKNRRGEQIEASTNRKENERMRSSGQHARNTKKPEHFGNDHPTSPRKLYDPWRSTTKVSTPHRRPNQLHTSSDTHSPRKNHRRQRPSKQVSLEALCIAANPEQPQPPHDPFMTPSTQRSLSPQISPTARMRQAENLEMQSPLFARSEMEDASKALNSAVKFVPPVFMSRARLQATL